MSEQLGKVIDIHTRRERGIGNPEYRNAVSEAIGRITVQIAQLEERRDMLQGLLDEEPDGDGAA